MPQFLQLVQLVKSVYYKNETDETCVIYKTCTNLIQLIAICVTARKCSTRLIFSTDTTFMRVNYVPQTYKVFFY